jgi:hypothetical protein
MSWDACDFIDVGCWTNISKWNDEKIQMRLL